MAFEWYRVARELDERRSWPSGAANVDDSELDAAAQSVATTWSLVDALTRRLIADALTRDEVVLVRAGGTEEDRTPALAVIRGVGAASVDSRGSRHALLALSERFLGSEMDHLSYYGVPSPEHGVRASVPSPDMQRIVTAVEQEFLASSGDPRLLLVDDYVCVEIHSEFAAHQFLMSRRGSDWRIVLWPSTWGWVARALPPQPSGPGGEGPAGVREPTGPRPPHASGGAARDLPGT